MEAVHFRLDYPGVNCEQCLDNLRVDGLPPECGGCGYRKADAEARLALDLYDAACPWGELDGALLAAALDQAGLRGRRRKVFHRRAVLIHRIVRKHHARTAEQG